MTILGLASFPKSPVAPWPAEPEGWGDEVAVRAPPHPDRRQGLRDRRGESRLDAPPIAQPQERPAVPEPAAVPSISIAGAMRMGQLQARQDLISSLPLIVLDMLASYVAASASIGLAAALGHPVPPVFVGGVVIIVLLFQNLHGLYPACGLSYSVEFRRIIRTCLVAVIGVAFGLAIQSHVSGFDWPAVALLSLLLPISLCTVRPIARHLLARFDWWCQPVVVLGDGERAERMHARLSGLRCEGLRPVGIVSLDAGRWSVVPESQQGWSRRLRTVGDVPESDAAQTDAAHVWSQRVSANHLGSADRLEPIMQRTGACRLAVVAQDGVLFQNFHSFHGIPHVMMPTELSHQPTERVRLCESDGRIELHCHTALTKPHALLAKRVMDLTLVLGSAPFWLPVMAIIALVMKLTDPGPILYRQSRVGRHRTPFEALKFRSMVVDADQKLQSYLRAHPEMQAEWDATHKLQEDPRVTPIGSFLRKSSLDELPQLINVLRGEMSLVGPRPIIDCSNYDREYIQEHPDVFELYQMVRPGITGMWQVSGRNATSYKQRVHFDRSYLHNWSIELDLFILWRTIKTALFREGAC